MSAMLSGMGLPEIGLVRSEAKKTRGSLGSCRDFRSYQYLG